MFDYIKSYSQDPNRFKTLSRCCLIMLIVWFCSLSLGLCSEPWKCGTPLLCEKHPPIQDISKVNAAPAAPMQPGQIERFFIHIPEESINATCVAVGVHCYIYIEEKYQQMITETQAKSIANTFDTRIYPEVHHWLGMEDQPGLDRDNRITILFHDVGMNESGQDYGGYFSPTDQYPTLPSSNRRNMLYMDIFQYKERSQHTFYSSLAHEFAHLVNWYQNGGTTDQRWLEEGIASFTEWGIYGTVHNLFVDGYLADPSMSLTTANNNEIYYGAAYMLMLYLYEKHGGINFIRDIAAENKLGIPAINATLGETKSYIDVFLNWGIANWFNNQTRGRVFSYQNLPNRRITAQTSRITRYPKTSNEIPVDSWGINYILFDNLPDIFELTLSAKTPEKLHANIVYFSTNTDIPKVIPIPTISRQNNTNVNSVNKITIGNVHQNGQILLVVTSEYPQQFRYEAKLGSGTVWIDIASTPNTSLRIIDPLDNHWINDDIIYPIFSNTQPIYEGRTEGKTLITPNVYPKLQPRSQIHLSSNYKDIIVREEILFAASGWGLELFSLNPLPTLIGEIGTPGTASAITKTDNYVYIADGEFGVHLIDVTTPKTPMIVKTLGGFHDAVDVYYADGDLYTLDRVRGLLVFNHQDNLNNENPLPRRSFQIAGTPFKVSKSHDGKIYVSDDTHGLYILRSDPLGGYNVIDTIPFLAHDFEVFGQYALVASSNLRIFDIEPPATSHQISRLNTPGQLSSVKYFQGMLYLTDQHTGLHIINLDSVQNPRLVSTHPTVGTAEDVAFLHSFSPDKTYAYVADGKHGIQTLDVTRPEKPIWINHYKTTGYTNAIDVVAENEKITIVIANGLDGLKTAEMTNPYSGKIIREVRSISGEQGALSVKIHQNHAFVGTDIGMDVVNLDTGEVISHIVTASPVWDINIIKNHAYLCAKSLYVVDISSPESSIIVSNRRLSGTAFKMVHSDSFAYVASLDGGVHIMDISAPALPRPISNYITVGTATNVALDEKNLYILDNRIGVLKLEIQNQTQPTLLSEYTDTKIPSHAVVQGDFLYLLDIDSLQIIDTRTMLRQTRYIQSQPPTSLAVTHSSLYVTSQYQLNIYRIQTDASNLAVEDPSQDLRQNTTLFTVDSQNKLLQNYPNPFNPETWIPYTLIKGIDVSLSIYDAKGHVILQDSLGYQPFGKHIAYWDGRNSTGEPVASGIYFYTLSAGDFTSTRKMLLQR